MSYYVGESAGPSASPTAAAPAPASPPPAKVPSSSEAPAKTDDKDKKVLPTMDSVKEFAHRKVAGPVEVWHVGAGLGAGVVGYIVYRMVSSSRRF